MLRGRRAEAKQKRQVQNERDRRKEMAEERRKMLSALVTACVTLLLGTRSGDEILALQAKNN